MALHDFHGLEGDDGFSLALSRFPLDTLLPGLAALQLDIHPPLHFLALKGWTAVAGDSLLSLRLMNLLADMLTGALVIRLAGRVFGRQAAGAAGVLWVAAPLLIYAGWLVRMYTLLTLFVTAALVCLLEAFSARAGRLLFLWFAGMAACVLAAMYTHIYGVVAAGALAAALVVVAIFGAGGASAPPTKRYRWGAIGLAALAVAGVLYLPYALSVLDVYRSGRALGATTNAAVFATPFEAAMAILPTLFFHRAYTGVGVLLLVGLALISLWLGWRQRRALPLIVFVWAALAAVVGLAWAVDLYKPRYLAPFVPPLLTLVGAGIAWRGGQNGTGQSTKRAFVGTRYSASAGGVALLAFLVLFGVGVRADLDRATRDDWTAAAAFITAHERPGDTVIVIPDWGQEAFRYHYRGAAPVTGVFPRVSADVDIAPILDSLTTGHNGVWLLRYQPEVSDAGGLVPSWFRARAATVTEVFPAGMQAQYYDFTPRLDALPAFARPLDARFGEAALRGAWLPVMRGSARDTRLHPPSAWVHVVLYWEALGAPFVPRVRLTDSFGQVYAAALERDNGVLARHPVETWQLGEVWALAADLNLNPETPPGVYNIEVMALDPASGEPLPASGTDAGAFWVIAGNYTVE
jgi:hypothetical protein